MGILQEFLRKRAYPLFKGCAEFFVNWLVEDGKGHLVTNPSTSPEHYFIAPDGQRASVSYGSTMDMAILKNLFNAVISAAKVSWTPHALFCWKNKQGAGFPRDFNIVFGMVVTILLEIVAHVLDFIMAVDPRGGRNRVDLQSQIICRTVAPSENW